MVDSSEFFSDTKVALAELHKDVNYIREKVDEMREAQIVNDGRLTSLEVFKGRTEGIAKVGGIAFPGLIGALAMYFKDHIRIGF